jgi:peptidoglycan hydrolase CwlO-like protein
MKKPSPLSLVKPRTTQQVQFEYTQAAGEAGVASFTLRKAEDQLEVLHERMNALNNEFMSLAADEARKQNEAAAAQQAAHAPVQPLIPKETT